MTANWTSLAEARGIPDPDRFHAALDSLEAAFRPLVSAIPFETEPAPVTPVALDFSPE